MDEVVKITIADEDFIIAADALRNGAVIIIVPENGDCEMTLQLTPDSPGIN